MIDAKRCTSGDIVCRNIKLLRKKAKLSQEELNNNAGLGNKYINSVERFVFYPSYQSLEKIAKALSVDVYKLFIDDVNFDYKKDMNKKINDILSKLSALQIKAKVVENELKQIKL